MNEKDIDILCNELDKELKKAGLSRRDALKLLGLSSTAFMLNPTSAKADEKKPKVDAKNAKILIVGGGAGGCTIANYLTTNLDNPHITIIEPNPQSIRYQPGQTLIGAGVWTVGAIMKESADFFPSDAKWIKDSVAEFDPDNNKVTTKAGKTVEYDFMVLATGIQLNYDAIEGLNENMIGSNGLGSVYFANGATKTWAVMQDFINKAKNQEVKGLFTHPNTPIKCGGAPKKMIFLTNSRLLETGDKARKNATLTFLPNGGKMFGVPEYHEAILKQFKEKDLKFKYKHNLVAIDADAKKATFDHKYSVKGEYDKDLEEYTMITKTEKVTLDYDFIHITPPQSAPDEVKNSPLSWKKGSAAKGGWAEVDKETLQHRRYPNVFAIGDVAGIPMGKTGGSVRQQYPVCGNNLIEVIHGKKPTSKYNGYTVCPLITEIGSVMLLEFNWTKKPTPSFPFDPTKSRWMWWALKVYGLRPMYFYGMLKGMA